jgi:pimeloyl-ACP methyl ester carboxylesterase
MGFKSSNYDDIEAELRCMQFPPLIVVGDQDDTCIEGSLFLKKTMPNAGLAMLPMSGHLLPLEEPHLFNRLVLDFITLADAGKWAKPSAPNAL